MTQYLLTEDCHEISAGTLVEIDGMFEGGKHGDWYFIAPVGVKRDPDWYDYPEISAVVRKDRLKLPVITDADPGDETEAI